MKNALLTCFTGILLTGTITIVSYSQTPIGTPKPVSPHEKFLSSSEEIDAQADSSSVLPSEISTKAVKNFTRDYKSESGVQWFKLEKGFAAYFTNDGIKTRVFYTKQGDCAAIIRDYFEDKLPSEVRHLVKSTYYDFSIHNIKEVTINRIIAYVIKIQDKTSWKTIKVVNGEMEVMEEYSKS